MRFYSIIAFVVMLSGISQPKFPFGISVASAQSRPAPIMHRPMREPLPDKAAVDRAIAFVAQVELCKTPISLQISKSSLQEIVVQVQGALPRKTTIEVRSDNPAHLTFDLKNTPASKVLQAVATLAGGKFYIFSDHLLVASEKQLSDAERAEIKTWANAMNSSDQARGEAEQILARFIASNLDDQALDPSAEAGNSPVPPSDTAPDAIIRKWEMRFGAIRPDLQVLVQQLVTWHDRISRLAPLQLGADTILALESDPKRNIYRLQIKTDKPGNSYRWMCLR